MTTGDSNQPTSPVDSLADFLRARADDLAASATGVDTAQGSGASDGLVFMGEWNESYPGILVRDPFLTQSAKVQFLYLMQESKSRSMQAYNMPSAEGAAQAIGQSRKTVSRDRLLLRITRWTSLFQQVRDQRGRFRGGIYALHSEPAPLGDATSLDDSYMALLHDSRQHADQSIRTAADAALAGIDAQFARGEDPTAPPDRMGRRVNAHRAIQGDSRNFFDLMIEASGGSATDTATNNESAAALSTGDADEASGKFTHGEPCVELTHGGDDPCVKLTHGGQVTDNNVDRSTYPQMGKFTHGTYRSSSNTTTTTTNKEGSVKASEAEADGDTAQGQPPTIESLRWPDAFNQAIRHLIHQALTRRRVEPTQFQDVIDVLAHKTADSDNPLRNPVGYAVKLCERITAGTFQPIGQPQRNQSNGHGGESGPFQKSAVQRQRRELRAEIRSLKAEITHMDDNLIAYTPDEQKPRLEANRDQLSAQLEAKKSEYHALDEQSESAAG
ncbi:STY4528 family pathogenicity island replication protein [Salinisphaera orenii]|uniref:STY4528 family pathogenicity island replication protein n=1 Tax=Salinisphaera orenii TaxID=856731 RepID=UPI000DBE97C0